MRSPLSTLGRGTPRGRECGLAVHHDASCTQLLHAASAAHPWQVALESIQALILDVRGQVFQYIIIGVECVQLQKEGGESGLDPLDKVV